MDEERKKKLKVFFLIVAIITGIIMIPWGIDALGEDPRFVDSDWIELDKIQTISKFRSTVGHGYGILGGSNPTSDKHYYLPTFEHANSQDDVQVFAPTRAIVTVVMNEQHRLEDGSIQGKQIHLMSLSHPSITFILFHIKVAEDVKLFSVVDEGQQLGYADLRDNSSTDIAVTRGGRYISYFQVMTDDLFSTYQSRGIQSRDMMVKTDEQVQKSVQSGYGFDWESGQESDPADWVMMKNTEYTNLIDTAIVNPQIIDNVSYAINLLMDTNDDTDADKFSFTTWFSVDDAHSSSYSNPVYVPFDVKVQTASVMAAPNINHTVTVQYHAVDYTLELTYYGLKKVTDLGQGDTLNVGDKIGDIASYLGVKCRWIGRYQEFSVFELMSESVWNGWNARGLANRSSNVLNFMEFEEIAELNAQTDYSFDPSASWWLALN